MKKNVVVFGGGNGMSTLLSGLKLFPISITSVVSVSDDGKSTGRLREEFNMPAVGDIRRVLIALSETEPLVEELFNYRFETKSDLNGHTVGNLLLTATSNITDNLSDGIEALSKVLNLKGNVLPLTEDNVVLKARMTNGVLVEGETEITNSKYKIKDVFYKEKPVINEKVINEIKKADFIILSMGSLYTSVMPHLICKEVIEAIDKSKAKILYVCNIMTQPGETDNYNVSDHVETLNKYLGKNKISAVFVNNGKITTKIKKKYSAEEQKDPVVIDNKILKNENIILKQNNYIKIKNDTLIHNVDVLCLDIYSYILFKK